jgi:hypothetical protein
MFSLAPENTTPSVDKSIEPNLQTLRSGLAHTFCIDWVGIQHREEIHGSGPEYLFCTTQGFHGGHGLGIIPRECVRYFDDACEELSRPFQLLTLGARFVRPSKEPSSVCFLESPGLPTRGLAPRPGRSVARAGATIPVSPRISNQLANRQFVHRTWSLEYQPNQ